MSWQTTLLVANSQLPGRISAGEWIRICGLFLLCKGGTACSCCGSAGMTRLQKQNGLSVCILLESMSYYCAHIGCSSFPSAPSVTQLACWISSGRLWPELLDPIFKPFADTDRLIVIHWSTSNVSEGKIRAKILSVNTPLVEFVPCLLSVSAILLLVCLLLWQSTSQLTLLNKCVNMQLHVCQCKLGSV